MRSTATAVSTADLHPAYVAAINSNDTDRILGLMSEDVVFQVPGEAELVGKDAVGAWANTFFAAYEASWDKTEIAMEQSGDLAISRYVYVARYRSREDGSELHETGKGVCIFRCTPAGEWRLMIDSWSTH
ncbi:YybH family protein [Erythrobacter sp. MTPC3]|uniref:YybH family protein n=1 Tax=Erythrobacter sp. MTPC3 TaxID=3056564 RepID=UPI0036F40AD9